MSTLEELKKYLVGNSGYLLNDDNNGKTVMLSGAWGSGKTHFWQNEIEREQKKVQGKTRKVNKYSAKEYKAGLFSKLKIKKKACVYVSLYGEDNMESLKSKILLQAYSGIKEKNTKKTKAIAAFGIGTKILANISILGVKVDAQDASDATKNYYDMKQIEDATEFLSDGGLICFDDFERKSKKIDLNDLFGFISQLAIDMNCKVVIILNSDVFEGEEANVFKTVKEKTVNKFFYFKPEIEELFNSIYMSDKKYKMLDKYKTEILNAIKETEELNARIYIQVLDNCWEWIEKGNDGGVLRDIVISTVFFIKYHLTLRYEDISTYKIYDVSKMFRDEGFEEIYKILNSKSNFDSHYSRISAISNLFHYVHIDKANGGSEDFYKKQNEIINENKDLICDFVKYIYSLEVGMGIGSDLFTQINNHIKSGIWPKKDKELLS